MSNAQLIKIKLSPILSDEVALSCENLLADASASNDPYEITYCNKVVKNRRELELETGELRYLYNDLYNLEDLTREWADYDEERLRWLSVNRSIKKHLANLRELGVETDGRGWAK